MQVARLAQHAGLAVDDEVEAAARSGDAKTFASAVEAAADAAAAATAAKSAAPSVAASAGAAAGSGGFVATPVAGAAAAQLLLLLTFPSPALPLAS